MVVVTRVAEQGEAADPDAARCRLGRTVDARRGALTVLIASRNGLILGPAGSVLKVSARVAMVTALPPAALDRSEMTGIGVKIVSMTGCSGLVASMTCSR